MRKRVITPIPHGAPFFDQGWLDVGKAASVEVTSEDQIYPIECALLPREKRGWRSAEPGTQSIRLIFDEPQKLRRILLVFEETETKCTHPGGNGERPHTRVTVSSALAVLMIRKADISICSIRMGMSCRLLVRCGLRYEHGQAQQKPLP